MKGEIINIHEDSLGFIAPFRVLVAGSSSCGKSELIARILENSDKFFSSVTFNYACYFYPEHGLTASRKVYCERLTRALPCMECAEGLPDVLDLINQEGNKLIIIDDLYDKAVNSSFINDLMTVHSHHANISIIFTAQNYFSKGQYSKTFQRNYTDTILFDAKLERLALEIISRQVFPGISRFLPRIMEWLRINVKSNFERYVLIESNPQSQLPEKLRVRSHIIPHLNTDNENYQLVFIAPD